MTIVATAGGRSDQFPRSSKMISRQSSVSISSRVYYRSSGAAGFPFTWERLPGEPKQKPANDGHLTPPLSPPPALHSLSLPKPIIQNYLENKKSSSLPSKLLLLKLWEKMSKKMKKKQSKYSDAEVTREAFGFETSYYSSSPCSASSLSSSSSSSTMDHHINNGPSKHVNGAKPFARASRGIGRMVVACAPGTKRN